MTRLSRPLVVLALLGGLMTLPAPAAEAVPTGVQAEVERLYVAFFQRSPDAAGLSFWSTQRRNGVSLAVIADSFAASDEFRMTYGTLDDTGFVRLVYRNVLLRDPDEGGLAFWVGQLRGTTRGRLMIGFSESAEFRLRLGHVDLEPLQRLYRAFFLREPDPAGLASWAGRYADGASLASIADAFAGSQEFIDRYGRLDDAGFVTLVYRNVLGRAPDPDGLTYWAGQLRSISRGLVMIGFSESREFRGETGPEIGGCPLFPEDSFWTARADQLPVHPRSSQLITTIGRTRRVHMDFGSGLWDGGPIGIPFTTTNAGPSVPVQFDYDDESDPSPYPIPRSAPIEFGGDHHILVVDTATCILHELFAAEWQNDGSIRAGSGARWDLTSNDLRPAGWTSADAAGLPILPGLVRYDEVAAGSIDHAIRFTAPVTANSYVWPARHQAGRAGADLPPMGTWVRLRAGTDLNRFSGQARVIAEALLTHGAILADNGSSWYFSGAPDERWDNDELHQLDVLTGNDFEVVDASGLMVSPDSGQRRT